MSTASIRVETVLIPTYGVGQADKNPMFLDTTRLYACASNAHDGWFGHRGGSDFYTATNLRQHQLRAIYAEMGAISTTIPPMRSMPARPSTPIPCGCIRRLSLSAPHACMSAAPWMTRPWLCWRRAARFTCPPTARRRPCPIPSRPRSPRTSGRSAPSPSRRAAWAS